MAVAGGSGAAGDFYKNRQDQQGKSCSLLILASSMIFEVIVNPKSEILKVIHEAI
jgi:hypothetical protein